MNRMILNYVLVFSTIFLLSYCAKSLDPIAADGANPMDVSGVASGAISLIEPQVSEINMLIDSLQYFNELFEHTENPANKKNIQIMISNRVIIFSTMIDQFTSDISLLQDSLTTLIGTFAIEDTSVVAVALRTELTELQAYRETELIRITNEYEKYLCIGEGRVCTVPDSIFSSSSEIGTGVSNGQPIEKISSTVSGLSSTELAVSSVAQVVSSIGAIPSSTVSVSSVADLSTSSSEGTVSSTLSSTLSSVIVSSQLSSQSSSVSSSVVISSSTISSQAVSSSSVISSTISSSSLLSSAVSSSSLFSDTTEILNINGTSRFIDMRGGINTDWQTDGISMELWTLWDTFDQHTHLIHLSNGNDYNYMIALGILIEEVASDTIIHLKYVVNNSAASGNDTWARDSINTVFTKGKWCHVAVTVTDVGRVTFYVNGEMRQSMLIGPEAVPDNTWRGTNNIGFGKETWDGNFDGRLDNVRIWNRALSASEVKDNMFSTVDIIPDTSGLVIGYDFNYESSDPTVVFDQSANGIHGDLIGMTGQYGYDKDWRDQVDFRTKVP